MDERISITFGDDADPNFENTWIKIRIEYVGPLEVIAPTTNTTTTTVRPV